jgi:hypothetical protein
VGSGGLVIGDTWQAELYQTHPKDIHNPSFDLEDVPVLQVCKFGHQPQASEPVHSEQDECVAHASPEKVEGGDAVEPIGTGEGSGEGLVIGDTWQAELYQTHPEDVHNPSFDLEDVPVLQVCKFGHQPHAAAIVQSEQDERAAHASATGGGGGDGGMEPLAKAVQLKTDKTGSELQTEF